MRVIVDGTLSAKQPNSPRPLGTPLFEKKRGEMQCQNPRGF